MASEMPWARGSELWHEPVKDCGQEGIACPTLLNYLALDVHL